MTDKIDGVPARLLRAGTFEDVPATGEDDRRVWVTFSSETPVLRKFKDKTVYEILGHDDGEVDLSRMANGRAPLLKDHVQSVDSQVGFVETVEISDGRGRALVKFGVGAVAQEVLARVRDGEISGVSVGYTVTRFVRTGTHEGLPMLRAQWSPFEITLCPVPADPIAGIGHRAAEGETLSFTLEPEDSDMADANTTPTQSTPPAAPAPAPAVAPETRSAAPAAPQGPSIEDERKRSAEIVALGRQHNMPEADIDAAISGGRSIAEFQGAILDHIASDEQTTTRSKSAEIGMNDKEVRNYSLMNAVRFLVNPTDAKIRAAAAFEIECSEAAERSLGKSARGLMIPADVLANQNFLGQRAMDTTTAAALVGTDHMDGSFIGLLRKRAALSRLGIRTLSGLMGDISIPRQTGASTAYWVGEGSGPTASEFTTDNKTATPHTLAGAVPITRKAMIQTSPDVEMLVRDDLVKVIALEADRVGINGDADADAPDGLLDNTITDQNWAAVGQPTWSEVVDMETKIMADDADVADMKYLFPATVVGHLKSTPKVSGTAVFMTEGGQTNGYSTVMSNQTPAAGGLFGNWSDFVWCLWSGLDLTVDTATLAASGGIFLRAFQDMDFICRQEKSFVYGRNF